MSPTSNDSERSLRRGPLGPGVSDAGSIASYGARMSTVQPDSPTSTILPPTRSPTRGKYPPFRDDCDSVAIDLEDPYARGKYPGSYLERVVAEKMVSFGEELARCHYLFGFRYDYQSVLTLVEDLHLNSSLCHLANSVCERPIHACGHLYNRYQGPGRLPLFAGNRPEAFERVVGSSSVFWEYLYGYSHLFHLDRKDRSEVFYDLFRLLLSALVGID